MVLVMSWYMIMLPLADAGISGKAKKLQTAFETLFKANQAPKNAAMFTSLLKKRTWVPPRQFGL
jgi:hypothetical protein